MLDSMGTHSLVTLLGLYLICSLHLFVPQSLFTNTEVCCYWTHCLLYLKLIVLVPARVFRYH